MTIRNGLASSLIALTLAATFPRSVAESASESAIASEFAIESARRNPQSAMAQWRVLFDGKSLDAFRGYKTDKVPGGWHIADGTLAKDTRVEDLVSKDEFGDFELEVDWKIGEAGNSGI